MKIFSRFCTRFRAVTAVTAAAIALSVSFGMVGSQAGAASGTISWTGNGTNAGLCANSESLPVTVPDNEQAWLFILTQPGTGPFTISTTFSPALPAGDTSTPGTQEGHGTGAVHFIVFSPLGATLTSASAMTGTDNSVLTVSGCQDGAPVTTTTTTTTTDPSNDTTTTTTDDPTTTTTTDDTTTTTDDPTTTTTAPSNDTTTTTTDPSTGGNSTGGDSTGGGSPPPSNVVFTPDGGAIVSTAAPTVPLNQPMNHSAIAFTGANIAEMAAVGIALVGVGSLLILVARRRRQVA